VRLESIKVPSPCPVSLALRCANVLLENFGVALKKSKVIGTHKFTVDPKFHPVIKVDADPKRVLKKTQKRARGKEREKNKSGKNKKRQERKKNKGGKDKKGKDREKSKNGKAKKKATEKGESFHSLQACEEIRLMYAILAESPKVMGLPRAMEIQAFLDRFAVPENAGETLVMAKAVKSAKRLQNLIAHLETALGDIRPDEGPMHESKRLRLEEDRQIGNGEDVEVEMEDLE
jgi:hypothetical protein